MHAAQGNLPETVVSEILTRLKHSYPEARCGLNFTTPFELLVATILSAQCSDLRVNAVTERLFGRANTPETILSLGEEQLQAEIRECGLFRNKSQHIIGTCRVLLADYGGDVPADFESLVRLPGVGRKTANVILSNAFGQPAMPVDTHVFRVSNRIGLAQGKTPREVEEGLKNVIPRENWSDAHHLLIHHGRQICKARRPRCRECQLIDLCMSSQSEQGEVLHSPVNRRLERE
ncbi:MAG: endonuclease III [Firmicutes bacterium]|nr:endonuclease III [Bacillota bacterium]